MYVNLTNLLLDNKDLDPTVLSSWFQHIFLTPNLPPLPVAHQFLVSLPMKVSSPNPLASLVDAEGYIDNGLVITALNDPAHVACINPALDLAADALFRPNLPSEPVERSDAFSNKKCKGEGRLSI